MRRSFALFGLFIATASGLCGQSPYESSADFAKYAMKLREQALLKVEPQVFVPTTSRASMTRFPWKTNIVTTVFWIGEAAAGNNPVPNVKSSWDANWTANYGGFDTPDTGSRRNYIPVAFVPRQNPFYCALPYNDVTHGQFKPEAPLVIPWFKQGYTEPGRSVCKDRWLAIRKGNRTCYAQWEDCGPFRTDHFQYVFQNERPKPNLNRGAGLDVSPAVRDYLGLSPTDVTDWQFVEVRDVPPGPWRNYGDNNHFVIAKRQSEQSVVQEDDRQEEEVIRNPARSLARALRGEASLPKGRVSERAGIAEDLSPQPSGHQTKRLLQFLRSLLERFVAFAFTGAKGGQRRKRQRDLLIKQGDGVVHLLLDRVRSAPGVLFPSPFRRRMRIFFRWVKATIVPMTAAEAASTPVTSATAALLIATMTVTIPPAAATPAGNRSQVAVSSKHPGQLLLHPLARDALDQSELNRLHEDRGAGARNRASSCSFACLPARLESSPRSSPAIAARARADRSPAIEPHSRPAAGRSGAVSLPLPFGIPAAIVPGSRRVAMSARRRAFLRACAFPVSRTRGTPARRLEEIRPPAATFGLSGPEEIHRRGRAVLRLARLCRNSRESRPSTSPRTTPAVLAVDRNFKMPAPDSVTM